VSDRSPTGAATVDPGQSPPGAEPMIRLEGVGKTYPDGTVAVQELDLDVPRGRTVCLVGPSGCGKSTTLKMVNRLIEPTTGRILLDGEDITHGDPVQLRRRIGYVIQQVGLFPHQTIRANVATVPSLLGWDKRKAASRADELLDLVGLDPAQHATRYPHQLSGGQRQRVGVARALAADPPVLLMDEPFGAVDPIVRTRLQDEFARIARDLDKTVLFVTHDIDEAIRMGDKVAVFAVGGRLAQYDEPAALLGRPADDFVAQFVGASRGLRRLSVTPISQADLEPADGREPAESVPLSSSLEDALATMLRQDDARVAITSDGRTVGVLTPDTVHRALRRSVHNDSSATSPPGTPHGSGTNPGVR
jgi:osmoprotectant transport system ATP-binding protein